MGRRTRKVKGKILKATQGAVLFQSGEKKTFLPKGAIAVERADGRERFAPGEVTVHVPAKMAARKFGPWN